MAARSIAPALGTDHHDFRYQGVAEPPLSGASRWCSLGVVNLARLVPTLTLTAALVSVVTAFASPAGWPYTLPPVAFLTLWSVRLAHREA